jgi:prepilin signal peptidase PulO-like enzyme (type II secretory pathway)
MLPWIALPAAILGWVLGWLSAWLSDWAQPPDEAQPIRGRGPLVRDPLVQGGLAVIWAAIPFVLGAGPLQGGGAGPLGGGDAEASARVEDPLRWLEAGLLAVPLVQVAVTDLRTRYVYTLVAGSGLLLGLAFGWQLHGVQWWWSVVGALGGALLFGALYGVGRLMYRGGEPMARGDITIAAMVGAGAAMCVLNALVYGVLAGGIIALVVLVAARSRHVYMPYGPGLCLGGLVTLFLC